MESGLLGWSKVYVDVLRGELGRRAPGTWAKGATVVLEWAGGHQEGQPRTQCLARTLSSPLGGGTAGQLLPPSGGSLGDQTWGSFQKEAFCVYNWQLFESWKVAHWKELYVHEK